MIIKSAKIRNNTTAVLFLAMTTVAIHSCGSSEQGEQMQETGFNLSGDTIILTENSNIRPRLTTIAVDEQSFKEEWTTAGIVRAIPNSYAEIAAPFAGRVVKSHIKLGQRVSPGSAIFEINSPDFFNAQKDYFDARQEMRQAELNLKRQQDLLANGVGVQRELEEAETEFETARTARSNAASALKIFNVDVAKMQLGSPLIVHSPIKGEVVNNDIVIGQYLREDADAIVVVAELSKIWIAAQVKEKDVHHVREMDGVMVNIAAMPDKPISGRIYHVDEMVDEDTRSVQVLIECDNSDRILRPGMYVTVLFKDVPHPAILVPTKSIFQSENAQFVFVQIGKDRYQRRQVETAGTYNGSTSITSGLKTGEVIVNEGGVFLLKQQ